MPHRPRSWFRPLASAGLALLLAQSLILVGTSGAESAPGTPTAASPKKAPPLLPNLVAMEAADIHVQRSGNERKLRFESGIGNTGRGPVEVRPNNARPCPQGKHHATQVIYRDVDGSKRFKRDIDTRLKRRSAGCMIFHPHHNHWHFEAASRYTLFRPGDTKPMKVARRKMSFCLRDSEPVPARYGTFRYPEHYGACSKYSPQGISIGWVDIYQSFLAGQAMRLPRRAEDGLYCLKIAVDPQNMLAESDDTDNTSVRAFRLEGDQIKYRDNKRCGSV